MKPVATETMTKETNTVSRLETSGIITKEGN